MLLNILLAVHIIVCIALIGVILLQRSEGGAFGMGGGGGGGGFMSARGAGDLLTRTTAILAALFFILSLTLTLLSGRDTGSSVTDRLDINAIDAGKLAPPPANPSAPSAPLPSLGGSPLPAAPQNAAPVPSDQKTQPADPLANLTPSAPLPANR